MLSMSLANMLPRLCPSVSPAFQLPECAEDLASVPCRRRRLGDGRAVPGSSIAAPAPPMQRRPGRWSSAPPSGRTRCRPGRRTSRRHARSSRAPSAASPRRPRRRQSHPVASAPIPACGQRVAAQVLLDQLRLGLESLALARWPRRAGAPGPLLHHMGQFVPQGGAAVGRVERTDLVADVHLAVERANARAPRTRRLRPPPAPVHRARRRRARRGRRASPPARRPARLPCGGARRASLPAAARGTPGPGPPAASRRATAARCAVRRRTRASVGRRLRPGCGGRLGRRRASGGARVVADGSTKQLRDGSGAERPRSRRPRGRRATVLDRGQRRRAGAGVRGRIRVCRGRPTPMRTATDACGGARARGVVRTIACRLANWSANARDGAVSAIGRAPAVSIGGKRGPVTPLTSSPPATRRSRRVRVRRGASVTGSSSAGGARRRANACVTRR